MKKKIVVLTGAGISAESGLKTFRDSGGLWEGRDVMEVASIDGWKKNPALVLQFYNERRNQLKDVQPNQAHLALARLETEFEVVIITQNVDDLHERAGSSKIIHLHGELNKMCSEIDKSKQYPIQKNIELGDLAPDGSQLRPFIVWFGEDVPMINRAIQIVQDADLLLIVGTSMVVYPAAGLIDHAAPYLPVIVLDPKKPAVSSQRRPLYFVEKSAVKGIEETILLIKKLLK